MISLFTVSLHESTEKRATLNEWEKPVDDHRAWFNGDLRQLHILKLKNFNIFGGAHIVLIIYLAKALKRRFVQKNVIWALKISIPFDGFGACFLFFSAGNLHDRYSRNIKDNRMKIFVRTCAQMSVNQPKCRNPTRLSTTNTRLMIVCKYVRCLLLSFPANRSSKQFLVRIWVHKKTAITIKIGENVYVLVLYTNSLRSTKWRMKNRDIVIKMSFSVHSISVKHERSLTSCQAYTHRLREASERERKAKQRNGAGKCISICVVVTASFRWIRMFWCIFEVVFSVLFLLLTISPHVYVYT